MSDAPAGPGWWQASDGRWYPPEQHPSFAPPPPPYPPLGYAPYGSPSYGYAPAPQTSGKAVGALVAAVCSFVICPVVPAIVSLVLAGQASSEIRDSDGRQTGSGLVTASRVISAANIVLSALMVVFIIVVVANADTNSGSRDFAINNNDAPSDVTAQRNLQRVLFTERLVLVETDAYTVDPAVLARYEPDLRYRVSNVPEGVDVIAVDVAGDEVFLATQSATSECFYLRESEGDTGYARDFGCGPAGDQSYSDTW